MNIEKRCLKEVKKRYKHNIKSRGKKIKEKKLNKLLMHAQIVKYISSEISRELSITERNKDLIKIAALLHDINKGNGKKDDKNHHKTGAKYIKKRAKKYKCILGCSKKEIKMISLMIRYHKGKTKYDNLVITKKELQMIEVVRIADKIAKLYKGNYSQYDFEKDRNKLKNKKVKEIADGVFKKHLKKYFVSQEGDKLKKVLW